MVFDFDIRKFFRRAPKEALKRYFEQFEVLGDFDWSALGPRKVDPLFDAWNRLDGDLKLKMGQDFLNLDLIGTAGGKTVIIDEAQFHQNPESVAPALAELPDPLSCAFWVYFERKDLWNGALFFAIADLKPKRRWRKRLNMPKLGREPVKEDADSLAVAVSEFFMKREARGSHCRVYPYRRRNKEYYFVYPQDHKAQSNEYDEKGGWIQRPYNPAFEIIFVHDDAEQSLTIWHDGSMDRVKDLQVAFANAVLSAEIPRNSAKDQRVYDLEVFRAPGFQIKPREELGIKQVEIRKLSLRTLGDDTHTTRIELGQDAPSDILGRRVEMAMRGIGEHNYKVASVGLRVTFMQEANEAKAKTRSFDISWPNSCSLDDDDYGHRIQQMLADHGIEPKKPSDDSGDGNQNG